MGGHNKIIELRTDRKVEKLTCKNSKFETLSAAYNYGGDISTPER